MSTLTETVLFNSAFNVIIRATGIGTSTISAPVFTGSGLNDLSVIDQAVPDTYKDTVDRTYRVEIDATGTPDTFRWSDNDGTSWNATGVPITGGNQQLNHGIVIKFNVTTGHTLNDYWQINAGADNLNTPAFSMPTVPDETILYDPRNFLFVNRIHYNTIGCGAKLYFVKDLADDIYFYTMAPDHSMDVDFTDNRRFGGVKNEFTDTPPKIQIVTTGLTIGTSFDVTFYTKIIAGSDLKIN